jgi:hypothetical protein
MSITREGRHDQHIACVIYIFLILNFSRLFANCKTSGDLGTSRDRKACIDCLAEQEKNMAAWNIDTSTDERKEKTIITENDIPGTIHACLAVATRTQVPTRFAIGEWDSVLSPMPLQVITSYFKTPKDVCMMASIDNHYQNALSSFFC